MLRAGFFAQKNRMDYICFRWHSASLVGKMNNGSGLLSGYGVLRIYFGEKPVLLVTLLQVNLEARPLL